MALYINGQKVDGGTNLYANNIPMSPSDSDTIAEKLDDIEDELDDKVDITDFYATNLPIESGSATNTKYYIDSGLSGKADTGDIPTNISDLSNDLEIGKLIKGTESGSTNVPTETGTEIGSITLNKGKYIIICGVDWTANSSGYRQIAFAANRDPSRDAGICQPTCPSPKETYLQLVSYRDIQADNTSIKIYGWQNSGSTLGAYPYIYAIKIY